MTHFYIEPAIRRITNQVQDVIWEQIGITGKELDFTGLFGASNDDVGM